jgi:hypothetical protein
MVQAKHHDEPENHYDETSSDPKTAATHEHSRSTSEDHIFTNTSEPTRTETSEPTRTETSEPTRNGQEVHYVGEVCVPFALLLIMIIPELIMCHQLTTSLFHLIAVQYKMLDLSLYYWHCICAICL